MNKYFVSLIVTLFIFPLGIVSAQNSTNNIQTTQAPKPIISAFGILLGEKFEPSMVTKVIGKEPQTYSGAEKAKLEGTVYQVDPIKPDQRFQKYSVKTTVDGIVYAILGEYQYETEMARGKQAGKVKNQRIVRKTCKAEVKKLAKELESMHGKPRGQGYDGEWFSFRQSSETSNKSLKLYAHRCRTGLYSIIYVDNLAQKKPQAKP